MRVNSVRSILGCSVSQMRGLSSSASSSGKKHFKLVVVGGGSGGCSTAAKFARKLDPKSIAVVDPAEMHYYQPMWTLVGGGMKTLADSGKPMKSVLPKNISWIKEKVTEIRPEKNEISVGFGKSKDVISYDFLVVAAGIQLKYDQIKGLPEAFETPGVCSNYSPKYVDKTFEAMKNFKKGNAIFTFPNTPIKCAGAPQKILYITDSYLRQKGKRQDANLIFNTSLGVLFAVQKYADSLWKVVKSRDITVNTKRNLVEVISKEKKAVFENIDKPGTFETYEYEMLHVTPPMGPQDFLKNSSGDLVDAVGYVNLNKSTLQHVKYPNVFGIGDCSNLPTSKTAAAVAGECGVLSQNLWAVMEGKEPRGVYDGYTSCPLVTSYSTCILAEFDYAGQPLETFPINQAKERRSMFHMKKDLMPHIYWRLMLNGYWNGPGLFRKAMRLGFT